MNTWRKIKGTNTRIRRVKAFKDSFGNLYYVDNFRKKGERSKK